MERATMGRSENMARLLDIDPEQALHGSCERFIQRFDKMESAAESRGSSLESLSLDEQEALWQEAKQQLKSE